MSVVYLVLTAYLMVGPQLHFKSFSAARLVLHVKTSGYLYFTRSRVIGSYLRLQKTCREEGMEIKEFV